jgi:hypothetical protein
MSWYPKEQQTVFDAQPIDGLYFLIGAALARQEGIAWIGEEKFPLVKFPSGLSCEIWEGRDPQNPIIHLLDGEMDLPFSQTRDEAYSHAVNIAEQVGYVVHKVGENQLEIWTEYHLLVTYDNDQRKMIDVKVLRSTPEERPRMPLLDEVSRKLLPPLYSQESLGIAAKAVVKFFTPDANWTWYATEASVLLDDDTYKPLQEIAADDPHIAAVIFFGLVSGYELELGYFTLEELEELRGPFRLPVERDRHFKPKTLKELQTLHGRGEVG